MYVGMYVCTCVCVCVCTYVRMHTYIYSRLKLSRTLLRASPVLLVRYSGSSNSQNIVSKPSKVVTMPKYSIKKVPHLNMHNKCHFVKHLLILVLFHSIYFWILAIRPMLAGQALLLIESFWLVQHTTVVSASLA